MGRELKRVPLNFSWPLNQVWKGFINPIRSQQCKSCEGSGLNPATKELSDSWYSFDKAEYIDLRGGRRFNNAAWQYHLTEIEVAALLEKGRLWDFTRVPINDEQREIVRNKIAEGGNSWLPFDNGRIPTPDEVNEWAKIGMGHDCSNKWYCVEARARHLGVYGHCEYCNGEGEIWASPEVKKMHDDWEDFGPPTGEGFQLWETTSEGSPITPVFSTLADLCEWAAANASTFGTQKTTKEGWMNMLSDGYVYHKEGNAIFI